MAGSQGHASMSCSMDWAGPRLPISPLASTGDLEPSLLLVEGHSPTSLPPRWSWFPGTVSACL